MRIITISREFGSGGRELGKRLADYLGYRYYDREIIAAIAESSHMDSAYVENTLETPVWQIPSPTFRHSFTSLNAGVKLIPLANVLSEDEITQKCKENGII